MAATSLATAFVNLVPGTKDFEKKVKSDLSGAMDSVGKDGGERVGGGLLDGIKRFAGPIAAVLSTVAIGGFVKDAVKAASDLSESQNAIRVTFGAAASEIQKLGAEAATQLGLSNTQFNEIAVRFSSFAKNIAGPGGNVTKTLEDMTGRAADFASVMNIEVSEAAQIFQSGLAGETEPLKRFGIDLSEAAVKAYAYANGIATAGKELTESEKVQARYGLLMQSTSQVQGDFANTSDGLANGLRILRASFEDVKANIGSAFLPFMALGVAAINGIMGPIKEATQSFADFGNRMSEVYASAGGGMAGFQAMFTSIIDSISAFFTGGGLIQAFQNMAVMREQILYAILDALPAIIEGIVAFIPQFVTFITGTLIPSLLAQFSAIVTSVVTLMSTAIPQLITAVAQILPQLVTALVSMVPTLVTTLLSLIPMLLSAALTLFQSLITAIITVVPMIVTTLVGMLPTLVETLVSMLPGIVQAGIELFNGIVDGLITIVPVLLTAILDMLPSLIESLLSMLPDIILAAVDLFLGLVTGLLEALPDILTAIIDMIPKLVTTLVGMIPEIIDAGIELFLGLIDGLSEALPDIIVALIDMIPKLTEALISTIPQLIAAGFELLKGLVKGIMDNAPRILKGIAKAIGDLLLGAVKGIFGIKSPSREFFSIGEQLMAGLTNGIKDSQRYAMRAMEDVANMMNAGFGDASVSGTVNATGALTGSVPLAISPVGDFQRTMDANAAGSKTVNYYAAPNQSIDSEQALFTALKRAKVLAAW